MKKHSTYYFALLVVANLVITGLFFWGLNMREYIFEKLISVSSFRPFTELVLQHSWWAPVALAGAVIGMIVSIFTDTRSSLLCHIAFVQLVVEALLLSLAFAAAFLPLCTSGCMFTA